MYNIIFQSNAAGILYVGSCRVEMTGKRCCIKLPSCFSMQFFPFGDKYQAVTERVGLFSGGCKNVAVLQWDDTTFSIFISCQKNIHRQPLLARCQAESYGGLITLCDDGELYLLGECGDKMNVLPIDFYGRECSLDSYGGLARLQIEGSAERYLGLYELGSGFNVVYEAIGDDFSMYENNIRRVRKQKNVLRTNVEYNYTLIGGECRQVSTKLISYEISVLQKLTPLSKIIIFMDGISSNCSQVAELALTDEMRSHFSIGAATEYFGEFIDVQISPIMQRENVIALIYRSAGGLIARHCNFEIRNGKIDNFELSEVR